MKNINIRKKILFPYCGDTVGGSHLSSSSLIKELNANFDVKVLINSKKKIKIFLEKNDINFEYLRYPSYISGKSKLKILLEYPISFFAIFFYLLKIKPDFIHINDIRTLITWLPFTLLYRNKIIYHNRNPLPKSLILNFFIKKIKIITISMFLQKKLNIDTQMIYNPVHIENLNLYKDSNIDKVLTIGFFSNFSKKKRPDIFVEIANIVSKYKKSKFIMMGRHTEDELKFITKLIERYQLTNCIDIFDFNINHYEFMSKCNYIISCAVEESFGRIPIESNLLKIPIIASNSGGHKETVIDGVTGYLVEIDDYKMFSDKIFFLEKNQEIKNKFLENGYKHAIEKFSVKNHYKKIINHYI